MGVVGAQHRWQHGRISVKVNESHYVLDVTRETTRPLRRTLLLQMSQRGLLGALFDNYLRYGLRSSRLILCEIPVPISGQLGLGSERSNPPPQKAHCMQGSRQLSSTHQIPTLVSWVKKGGLVK